MSPLTPLFYLYPGNSYADDIVSHRKNRHLWERTSRGPGKLKIGTTASTSDTKNPINTIITLGKDADIIVDGDGISKVHCAFVLDPDTGIILLHDRSKRRRTGVADSEESVNKQINSNISDMVVVMDGLNHKFWFEGSDTRRRYRWEIVWNGDRHESRERAQELGRAKVKKYARRGRDDADRSLHSFLRPKEFWPEKISHFPLKKLGSGAFGKVSETVNVHTGGIMAVKLIQRPHDHRGARQFERIRAMAIEREIHYFKRIKYRHIVGYYGSIIRDDKIEILMEKKEGSLQSLVENWNGSTGDLMAHGRTALLHILSGLDYLDQNGLMHRDIKPDNVLYERRSSGYRFLLADLGGIKSEADPRLSTFGTQRFLAPEVFMGRAQTAKSDIWSTYITMLWVWNIGGFRDRIRRHQIVDTRDLYRTAVTTSAYEREGYEIHSMAIWDPAFRPSAAEMLMKLGDPPLGISHWTSWMQACRDGRNPLAREMEVYTGVSFSH
ncbi:kinase-like domain-containing protein [Xylariaceae sp. FL1272]|nr:kinase-like domain-containing protein [Xylariaceae sp. FL1272]